MKRFSVLLLLAAATAACIAAAPPPPASPPAAKTAAGTGERLVLLGTGGGPIARASRSQPATLLEAGGHAYLIDIGDGTPRQLARAGTRLHAIDAIFVTHLHFDHTAGLPPFMALDWQERRTRPVTVYGPPGTAGLVDAALKFLASGESIFRPELPDLGPIAAVFSGRDLEVTEEREVYRDDAVRVRATENSHYSTMHLPQRPYGSDRSYSYRFDTGSRSIVFTGDTGPSAAVVSLARDADILVSEVIDLPAIMKSLKARGTSTSVDQQPLIDHMAQEHLTPVNVGKLAAAARVKRLVLTHFALPPGVETMDKDRILADIRKAYSGPVTFGEDLASL